MPGKFTVPEDWWPCIYFVLISIFQFICTYTAICVYGQITCWCIDFAFSDRIFWTEVKSGLFEPSPSLDRCWGERWRHCVEWRWIISVSHMAAVLYGTAPLSYLAESIRRRADVEGRRHLRWSVTTTLIVRWVTRHFAVAAGRTRNSLPSSLRAATSLLAFRRQLKTLLVSYTPFRLCWLLSRLISLYTIYCNTSWNAALYQYILTVILLLLLLLLPGPLATAVFAFSLLYYTATCDIKGLRRAWGLYCM